MNPEEIMNKHYTKEITTPKDLKDGLKNFVQMIINEIENDNPREALLKAVGLLDDLESNTYDDAINNKGSKLINQFSIKIQKLEIFAISEYSRGVKDGEQNKISELKTLLSTTKN